MVNGILYTIENSSALIDGHIVREGDTIYGVKIIKIDQTKVEFEKNGKTWEQRVRQWPDPVWRQFN